MSTTTTATDLGAQVTAYLLDGQHPDAPGRCWQTHRNLQDGSVAVTVEYVPIGGRVVQQQILGNLADTLTDGGFHVTVETVWPEQTHPVDGGALWLHVTGLTAPQGGARCA